MMISPASQQFFVEQLLAHGGATWEEAKGTLKKMYGYDMGKAVKIRSGERGIEFWGVWGSLKGDCRQVLS